MTHATILDSDEVLNVLFYPRPEQGMVIPSDHLRPVRMQVEEGVAVGAYLHLAEANGPLVLFFHGNGETAELYTDVARFFTDMGVSFLVTDYRGYGSSDGSPTSKALLEDAVAVYNDVPRILAEENVEATPIFVMGRSIGSAAAIEVASHAGSDIAGLILDSPFAHTWPLVCRLGGPARLRDADEAEGFRSLEKIAGVHLPTLIIHGVLDRIIPVSEAEALHAASPAADKRLVKIKGAGHNNLFALGLVEYFSQIGSFVGTAA